ncbi:hypothetical protein ACFV00_18370 [Streptomyces californicus]|uniref:hypothetical protein n=1 Tax=Streptomyces californicus TaxID=67351 RepID=UPI0036C2CE37
MTTGTRAGGPGGAEGAPRSADAARLLRRAALFLPGAVPRDGRIAFWDPDGEDDAPGRFEEEPEPVGAPFGAADAGSRRDPVLYTPGRLTVVRADPAGGAPAAQRR